MSAESINDLESGYRYDDAHTPPPAKRSRKNKVAFRHRNSCLTELFGSDWFATQVSSFLTTSEACHLRAAASFLSSFVASYQWDDLSCLVPFQHLHFWRRCFPDACGVHVVLPALPHPSITTLEASFTLAPHDAIFERFEGLRHLRVVGTEGYIISDAAFAHLAGIVELSMPGWGDIEQLTDEGLKHLSCIHTLDFSGTFSLHFTHEGFRHLAGIHTLKYGCCCGRCRWQPGVADAG